MSSSSSSSPSPSPPFPPPPLGFSFGEDKETEKILSTFSHKRIHKNDFLPISVPTLEPKQSFVDLNDKQTIAIQIWGNENAAVKILAIHGWLDNSNTWNTLIPILLQKAPVPLHVVAVDLAGHGLSTHKPPSAFYNNSQDALDCFNVATGLGWDRFVVMGHSMGGVISTIMASMIPERIEKVISVDSFGPFLFVPPNSSYAEMLAQRFERAPELLRRQPRIYPTFEALFERYTKKNKNLKTESAHMIVSRGIEKVRVADDQLGEEQGGVDQPSPSGDQYGYCFRHDPRIAGGRLEYYTEEMVASFFSRISSPSLFFVSYRGRRRQTQFSLQVMARRKPYLTNSDNVVAVVDGEHHVHLDHPERVMTTILDFLFPPAKL